MSAAALWQAPPPASFETSFAEELEELEAEASRVVLEALLDRIESARTRALEGRVADQVSRPRGRFLCHRLCCSLATGEAEIAGRGFFDALDRPPLVLWLEAISRPVPGRSGVCEVVVVAFVPENRLARARAGRQACPRGALAFLDEVSVALTSQLAPLLASV
ncbi:MAG: hypothetical protein JRJ58_15355 [Deltaproteobacteria bacterium]|nr:hypothetical protein [Deltaproteobacteria bacterium]